MNTYAWFFAYHNFDDVKADAAYVEHLIKYNARATTYNGTLNGTSRSSGSGGKTNVTTKKKNAKKKKNATSRCTTCRITARRDEALAWKILWPTCVTA